MVMPLPSKQESRVRFPPPAPKFNGNTLVDPAHRITPSALDHMCVRAERRRPCRSWPVRDRRLPVSRICGSVVRSVAGQAHDRRKTSRPARTAPTIGGRVVMPTTRHRLARMRRFSPTCARPSASVPSPSVAQRHDEVTSNEQHGRPRSTPTEVCGVSDCSPIDCAIE